MSSNGDHEDHKEPNGSADHRSGQHHTFLQPLLPQPSQPSPMSRSPGPASPSRPMPSNGTGGLTQAQAPSTCPSLAPPANPNPTQEGEADAEAEDGEGDEEDEDEGYDGENDEDEIDCYTPRSSHTNSNNVDTNYFSKPHSPDPFALQPYGHMSAMPAAAAVQNGAGSQLLNTPPTIQNQNASAAPGVAGPQAASGTGNGITSSSLVFSLEDIEAVLEDCLHFCRRANGWSSPLPSGSQSPSEPTQLSSPTEKQDAKGKGKEPAVSPPPRPCSPCSRCAASAQQRLRIARRCRARDATKIAELEQEIEGYQVTIRDLKDQLQDLRSCLEELREAPDELAADDISERHTALKSTVDVLGTQIDRFLALGAGTNTAFAEFAASYRKGKIEEEIEKMKTEEETGEKKTDEETEEEKAEEKEKKFKKEEIEEMETKGKALAPTSSASPQSSVSIPPGVYELYATVSSQTRIRSPRSNPPATSVASATSSTQATPSQAPFSQTAPSQAPPLSQAPISQDPYTQGRSTKAPVVATNGHPIATAKPVNGVAASPPRAARRPPTLQIPSDASLGRAVAVQQSRSEHLGRGPIATVRSPPSQVPPAQALSSQTTSSQAQPATWEREREAVAAAERRRREARPFVDLIRCFTEERRRRNG